MGSDLDMGSDLPDGLPDGLSDDERDLMRWLPVHGSLTLYTDDLHGGRDALLATLRRLEARGLVASRAAITFTPLDIDPDPDSPDPTE